MPAPKRATLGDVCAKAGVSVYTASRALAGHDDVAAATKLRVQEAAAQLGYVANLHARSLKGGASKVIGIVVAGKANPYYATLAGAFEAAVEPAGYSCFVADAAAGGVYLAEREDRIVVSMIQQRVAAVVLTCAISGPNLERLKTWRIPALFVDCPAPEGEPYACVTADNFAGAHALGAHFAALGYRRWALVGHAPNWRTRKPREQGFAAAAQASGAEVAVIEGGNGVEVARAAVGTALSKARPQAIFATNTPLLRGVLLALRDLGLKPPRDVAVAAFDEFDWAEFVDPPITVVDQRIEEIGAAAGAAAVRLIAGEPPAQDAVIAPQLKIRASCGAGLARSERVV